MNKYWGKTLEGLTPYVSGEQPKDQRYVKLNTNENPYPPSPKVIEAIHSFDGNTLRLYPDSESCILREALSKTYDIPCDNIFVGNSSDEVLALSFLTFFVNDDPIAFPDVSYSFYPVYCNLYRIKSQVIPLCEDFTIDFSQYPQKNGGIIFPNPNAPTGIAVSLSTIEKLLCKHKDSVIICDEAYVDFGAESAIPLTKKYPNLLVVQTLSKSRSLAGLRVGYAIGNPDLIEGLNCVKNSFNSYPLDRIASAGAVAAIEDQHYFKTCCTKVIATRTWLCQELTALGFDLLPSTANFIFAAPPKNYSAEHLYQNLKNNGILIRYWNKPRISDWLRISIGTDDDMKIFLEKTKEILQQ